MDNQYFQIIEGIPHNPPDTFYIPASSVNTELLEWLIKNNGKECSQLPGFPRDKYLEDLPGVLKLVYEDGFPCPPKVNVTRVFSFYIC